MPLSHQLTPPCIRIASLRTRVLMGLASSPPGLDEIRGILISTGELGFLRLAREFHIGPQRCPFVLDWPWWIGRAGLDCCSGVLLSDCPIELEVYIPPTPNPLSLKGSYSQTTQIDHLVILLHNVEGTARRHNPADRRLGIPRRT